jgi:general secretion pathway protein L
MTTLILLLPQRNRLRAQGRAALTSDGPARGELGYLLSPDGQQISAQGHATPALLPRADTVIACPADADLSWHSLQLPRIARNRLPEALAGMLEDALLDDPEQLHFAIEPEATGGAQAWVAVCNKAWLAEQLSLLEQAQIFVDRVQPLSWPGSPAQGHFYMLEPAHGDQPARLGLHWRHAEGAGSLCLDGSLARDLLAPALLQDAQWTCTPESVVAAEHWLGRAVGVQSQAQRALAAARGPWNLRQFDLAPRARGTRALREAYRSLMSPRWRPLRWGLAALAAVQLLGLNLSAWQLHRELQARRAALTETLTATFPQVRAVLDAPVQMQRETELLRASAGRAGEQDFETLLAAAATAWPPDRGPVEALVFEPGRLQISASGWSPEQVQQFSRQLRSEGWQLDEQNGLMTLSRARTL